MRNLRRMIYIKLRVILQAVVKPSVNACVSIALPNEQPNCGYLPKWAQVH
jgi:hypothetical protein